MLFLHSDNESHFKRNKIRPKMTYVVQGWPRPLNRGGRLIQVTNTAKNRDFKNWPLNRGWPLNTGPLYTGSTVVLSDCNPICKV